MENSMVVGEYRMGTDDNNIAIVLEKKPNWFHRTMMRLFFGWRWITYSQPQQRKGYTKIAKKIEVPNSMKR